MQEANKELIDQIDSLKRQLSQEKKEADEVIGDKEIEISSLQRALREKDKEIQELKVKIENLKEEDGGVNNDLEQLEGNNFQVFKKGSNEISEYFEANNSNSSPGKLMQPYIEDNRSPQENNYFSPEHTEVKEETNFSPTFDYGTGSNLDQN